MGLAAGLGRAQGDATHRRDGDGSQSRGKSHPLLHAVPRQKPALTPGPSLRGTVPTGRQGCQLCAEGTRELLSRAVDGCWPVPGASQALAACVGEGRPGPGGLRSPPGVTASSRTPERTALCVRPPVRMHRASPAPGLTPASAEGAPHSADCGGRVGDGSFGLPCLTAQGLPSRRVRLRLLGTRFSLWLKRARCTVARGVWHRSVLTTSL